MSKVKVMKQKKIRIIGIQIDLGQKQRGVNMGPSAIRYAGLSKKLKRLGFELHDSGNLFVPVRDSLDDEVQEHFLHSIQQVCQATYEAGKQAVEEGYIPLFLGGDHSLAIGTIGGVTHSKPSGVIWVDAHGDANTPESSPSGSIHGMPVAALLGEGYPELVNVGRAGAKISGKDMVMIGIRDLDGKEREWLRKSGIRVYTMRELDERGMSIIIREALQILEHCDRLHVSLDMDSLDPNVAPGVGTPSPGGLSYREAQLLMEIIADSGKLASADLVEINPILDHGNSTAEIAVELIASLFGKSIL
ncbi:arginase [Malonomonas rubra DSM 5091]|uniref:Arginase n=1 Tax=Malonomonas rubra DSM 5091 TaxID=1122189 RepID=A0A1M6MMM9_MALRU|nr:arginase [Malonomonas rubra]SHJ84748.1 arginase [Malonomonas rubra DSM 5091]